MTKQNKLVTPGPVVTVDKKHGRKVGLALVDGNRMFSHGFEVDFPAHMNFRIMRHGPYSVMVLADQPCEVRIMQDGKLLAEQRLDPLPSPSLMHKPGGSDVRRQVRELVNAPQPFFISFGDDHTPLMFTTDPEGRSAEERLALQLYPKLNEPVKGASMHLGVDPIGISDEVFDIDPAKLGLPPAMKPVAPSDDTVTATDAASDESTIAGASSAEAPEGGHDHDHDETEAEATGPAKVHTAVVDATGEVAPSDYRIDAPLPQNWAPSHGLIAIGVRMIQVQTEGEPAMPPDGFEYVLFQLNTFEESSRVRANLHSRIKLPPKVVYRELDDMHHDPEREELGHRGCGHSLHDPKRFR